MIYDSKNLKEEFSNNIKLQRSKTKNSKDILFPKQEKIDTSLKLRKNIQFLRQRKQVSKAPIYKYVATLLLDENKIVHSKKPKMLFNDITYDSVECFFKPNALPITKRFVKDFGNEHQFCFSIFKKKKKNESMHLGILKHKKTPFQIVQTKLNYYKKVLSTKQYLNNINELEMNNQVISPFNQVKFPLHSCPNITYKMPIGENNIYKEMKINLKKPLRPLLNQYKCVQCYFNKKNLSKTEENLKKKGLVLNLLNI